MERQSGNHRGGGGQGGGQSRGAGQSRGGGQGRGGGHGRGGGESREGGQSRGGGHGRGGGQGQRGGQGYGGGQYRDAGHSLGDNQQRGGGGSREWGQSRDGGQRHQGGQRREQHQGRSQYQEGSGHGDAQSRGGGMSRGGGKHRQEGQQYREHHQGRSGQGQYRSDGQRGGYSQRGQFRGGREGGYQQGSQGLPVRSGPLVVPKDTVTGTQGQPIILETNYLSLNLKKFYERSIFQHDVTIEPSRFKRLLPKVMEQFRQEHFANTCVVFDGSKFLLSLKQLPEYSGEVAFLGDGYSKPLIFNVKIKFTKAIDLGFLQNYRQNPNLKQMTESSQVLSIILRGYPLMRHLSIGRNFYVRPQQTVDLSNGMELVRGLYQAPVLTQRGPMLNVDILNKAHPMEIKQGEGGDQDQKLLDLICDVCDLRSIPENLNEGQIRCILDVIKGKKVTYTIKGESRDYKINGFQKSPVEEIIPTENISVETYFAKKKQYKIKHRKLQLLWVGNQKRDIKILIPVELCVFKAGQMTRRNENLPEVVRRIIKETTSSTDERKVDIMQMVSEIGNYSTSPFLTEFGIEVGTDFELVQGRVLDPPSLKYSGNKYSKPVKGTWDVRQKQFFEPSSIDEWTVINLDGYVSESVVKEVTQTILRLAQNYGIRMENPKNTVHIDTRNPRFILNLRKAFEEHKNCQLLIVIFHDRKFYPVIKQEAELNVGCLTQCLLSNTIKNPNANVTMNMSNLLLKINAKCNGINHILKERPAFLKGNIMVMGADVTHPPPGTQSIPSFAAVTASHDCNFGKYNMIAQMQIPTEENIVGLEEITLRQLKFYTTQTAKKPDHIVFFRDGVSEGQFEDTVNKEVIAIKNACNTLKNYNPLITFVVVMKRHHTRLFPTNSADIYDHKYNNVPAGTVVDTGITHPIEMNLKDFYLASHSAIKGVTKPTKYCTIYDDAKLKYDNIEELAYYLCHMYTRCNRSVSYPAPTYYAHLAAERAKILWQRQDIDWAKLQKQKRIEIVIKNANAPMHFV